MSLLKPDIYIDTIYDLDLPALYDKGYRTLFCDIDNTVMRWDTEIIPETLFDFIEEIKGLGMELIFLSNARHERVRNVSDALGVKGIGMAGKPLGGGFYKAVSMTRSQKDEILMIGDQIFTDVLGARRVGIKVALVQPLGSKELYFTKFMRLLEKPFRRPKKSAAQ